MNGWGRQHPNPLFNLSATKRGKSTYCVSPEKNAIESTPPFK